MTVVWLVLAFSVLVTIESCLFAAVLARPINDTDRYCSRVDDELDGRP